MISILNKGPYYKTIGFTLEFRATCKNIPILNEGPYGGTGSTLEFRVSSSRRNHGCGSTGRSRVVIARP